MAFFLNIKDKVKVKDEKGRKIFCPPHHIPHKLPFTKPIIDEPCHLHKSKWRMLHHTPFCFLFCQHYELMIKNYKKYLKKKLKKRK